MHITRNEKGEFPSYAWPGGYEILYLTSDGGVLCSDCANGKNGSEATDDPEVQDTRSGWLLVGKFIHWEGPPVNCEHCDKEIESEYGDPEEEKKCGNK